MYAGQWADRLHDELPKPELEPEQEAIEPEAVEAEAVEPEPDPSAADPPGPAAEALPAEPATEAAGVPGLSAMPADWPVLPPNAALAAEVQWVQSQRLLVRDGAGVDLSKARSPAPSMSALSWLETSILFPSKFADVAVKVTQGQADEAEAIRRERADLADVEALLAEAREAKVG
jgi:hypothetical protein